MGRQRAWRSQSSFNKHNAEGPELSRGQSPRHAAETVEARNSRRGAVTKGRSDWIGGGPWEAAPVEGRS